MNGDPVKKKLSRLEFAASVKKKYPSYAKINDEELVNKMLEKYPSYADRVEASTPQADPLKKKEQIAPTGLPDSSVQNQQGKEEIQASAPVNLPNTPSVLASPSEPSAPSLDLGVTEPSPEINASAPTLPSADYDRVLGSLNRDLFAEGKNSMQKSLISREETQNFIKRKVDESPNLSNDERRSLTDALNEKVLGQASGNQKIFDDNDMAWDKEPIPDQFSKNQESYIQKGDIETDINTVKSLYGENAEEILISTYFATGEGYLTTSQGVKDTKTHAKWIRVGDNPNISDKALEGIYRSNTWGSFNTKVKGRKYDTSDADDFLKAVKSGHKSHEESEAQEIPTDTFEGFKAAWNANQIGYENPYKHMGAISNPDKVFAKYLKESVNETIDKHVKADPGTDGIPLEVLRAGGGYEGVKVYVDKTVGSYGLTPEEEGIKTSYSGLKNLASQIDNKEQNIIDAQNWLKIKSESNEQLSIDEQMEIKLSIKNNTKEKKTLEFMYSLKESEISLRKKDLLGVDSELPDLPAGEAGKQWNDDFKSAKKYYTEGYEGSLIDARVKKQYEIEALEKAVLLRDDLSRFHTIIKKGGNIFDVDWFDSDDILIREVQESRLQLMAINKVVSTKIDPSDRPRSYLDSFGQGVASSIDMGANLPTSQRMVNEFVNVASENGIQITKEQIARTKEDMGQKVSGAIGSTIRPMAELVISSAGMNALGATAAIGSMYNGLKAIKGVRDSRIALGVLGFAETATIQGVNFELAGQGAATGIGEGLGSETAASLMKRSPLGKASIPLLTAFMKRAAGATGQVLEEYAGEFLDELSKNDIGKAWANTLGDNPWEKAQITFYVSGLLGIASSGIETGKAMRNWEEHTLSLDPTTESIRDEQRAIYERNGQKLPDNLVKEEEAPKKLLDVEKLKESEAALAEATFGPKSETETTTSKESEPVVESPAPKIVKDPNKEKMEITDAEGRYYSVDFIKSLKESNDPRISKLKITNPTPEVEALFTEETTTEPVTSVAENTTETTTDPNVEPTSEAQTTDTPNTEVATPEIKTTESTNVTTEPIPETTTESDTRPSIEVYKDAVLNNDQTSDPKIIKDAMVKMQEEGLNPTEVDAEIERSLVEESDFSPEGAKALVEGYREIYGPKETKLPEAKTEASTPNTTTPNTELKTGENIEATTETEAGEITELTSKAELTDAPKTKAQEVIEKAKRESKNPDNKKTSKQISRFADASDSQEVKDIVDKIGKYTVTTNAETSDMVEEILAKVSESAAIAAADQMDSSGQEGNRKRAILSVAGAVLADKMTRVIRNPKSTPEQVKQAEATRVQALNAVSEASEGATIAGQEIALKKDLYKRFPHLYDMAKVNKLFQTGPLNKAGKDGKTLKENLDNSHNEILNDLASSIDENLTDKQLLDIIKKATDKLSNEAATKKKSETKAKDRQASGKAKIKAGIEAFKKLNNTANSLLPPDKIKAIGQIVSGLIEMGVGKASTIINRTFNMIKEAGDKNVTRDHIQIIAESDPEFNALTELEKRKNTSARIAKLEQELKDVLEGREKLPKAKKEELDAEIISLKEQIKKAKVISPKVLRDIAKMFYLGKIKEATNLTDAIVSRTELTGAEAEAYAAEIQDALNEKIESITAARIKAFNEATNKSSLKELEGKMSSGDSLNKIEKEEYKRLKRAKEEGREINRIMALINQGALTNAEFSKSFEKRFGYKIMSPAVKNRIMDIMYRMSKLNDDATRKVTIEGEEFTINTAFRTEVAQLNKEFNTLLEASMPSDTAKVLKEVLSLSYIFILSGPMTLVRAGAGGYSSGIIESITFLALNPRHWGTFFTGLVKALPAAWNRAIISRKTGFDYFGSNSLKGAFGEQGTEGSSTGGFENLLLRDLKKEIKGGKNSKVALKIFGQSFKVIHALGALDAFATTLTAGAAGQVMAKKAAKAKDKLEGKGQKTNLNEYQKLMSADFKALAEQDFENFKEDIETEVEAMINSGKIKPENKAKEVNDLMKERIGIAGSVRSAKKTYVTNRTQEIRENQLGESLIYAVTLAKEASLMGQPDGVAGVAATGIQKSMVPKSGESKAVSIVKFLAGMNFRFMRLTAQAGNKSANMIPILGMVNATIGVGWDPINERYTSDYSREKYRVNKSLAQQRIMKNGIMTLVSAALMIEMFDFGDDDDDVFTKFSNFMKGPSQWNLDPDRRVDIQAFGHSGMAAYSKNKKANWAWENLSISFTKDKDGNFARDSYISMRLNPEIGSVIASVGMFSDDMKGYNSNSDKQNAYNKSKRESIFSYLNPIGGGSLMGDNLRVATEGSFSSVGKMFKAFAKEEDPSAGGAAVLKEMFTGSIGSLINPSIWAFTTQELEASYGMAKSESKNVQDKIARNLYFLDVLISKDKKDHYGHIVPEVSQFGSYNRVEEHPRTWGLQYKFPGHGINISKKSFEGLSPDKDLTGLSWDGARYASTDEKLEQEALEYQEKLFTERLESDETYKYLNSLETKEWLEEDMRAIQKETFDDAKKYIVEKYKDTDKLNMIFK